MIRRKSPRRYFRVSEGFFGYSLILPALIFVGLLKIYSTAWSLFLSFEEVESVSPLVTKQVGAANWYEIFFKDALFMPVLKTTMYYSTVCVVVGLLLSLGIALALNEQFRGQGALRVFLIIPWAIPSVTNGYVWRWMLSAQYGIINGVLYHLGLIREYVNWLGTVDTALNSLVFVQIWKDVPFMTLLLLAGLQTVPGELQDAARVDGANVWQSFRNVTLPWMKTTISFVMIIEFIETFKAFDVVYVMTRGGPFDTTLVFYMYVYRVSFSYINFGYGSALAYTLAIIILCLSLVYVKILRTGELF